MNDLKEKIAKLHFKIDDLVDILDQLTTRVKHLEQLTAAARLNDEDFFN